MRRIPIPIPTTLNFLRSPLAKEPLFFRPGIDGFSVLNVAFLSHVVTTFRQRFVGSCLHVLLPLFPQLSAKCKLAPKNALGSMAFLLALPGLVSRVALES